ncbi:MAG TPA: response regulator [bacterium]|nr:response regulator [bacterium]
MLKGIRFKTILIIGSLVSGIIPLAILTITGSKIFGTELKEQAFAQLESVRDLKKSRIEETLRLFPALSMAEMNRVMLERSGMGDTGETYLVGPDLHLRSDLHLAPARSNDQPIATFSVDQALDGRTGTTLTVDYRGKKVLSAYAPITVGGERWALVAEIDEQEIDRRISSALYRSFTAVALISAALFVLLALIVSAIITGGINHVVKELEGILQKILGGRLEVRGDPSRVGRDFRGVMTQVNALADAFVSQTEERRKLESAVEFNQRMEAIGMLAGGITHDFNNTLGYMLAYADLVHAELPKGSPAEAHMTEILKAIDRATELVSQITTFSRRMKREKQPVRVASLITELVKFLTATLPKFITVKKDIRRDDIKLMADPVQLHQILMNLCTNAFHAMQDTGGTLTITLDAEPAGGPCGEQCFRLTIADTGCGMDDYTRRHALDPFFTTKPPGQGTGMGLAIVTAAVKNLNGIMEIESAEGQGTRISIILPLMEENEPNRRDKEEEAVHRGSGTVMFVDDEPHFCTSVRLMLEQLGYDVITFTDSPGGLASFRENPTLYDIVITDYNIPDMNGLELARRIKMIRPCIPVVVVTGYGGWDSLQEPSRLGIEAVVQKPFSRAKISKVVHEILRGAGSCP